MTPPDPDPRRDPKQDPPPFGLSGEGSGPAPLPDPFESVPGGGDLHRRLHGSQDSYSGAIPIIATDSDEGPIQAELVDVDSDLGPLPVARPLRGEPASPGRPRPPSAGRQGLASSETHDLPSFDVPDRIAKSERMQAAPPKPPLAPKPDSEMGRTFQLEDGFDSDLATDALTRGRRVDESSEMGRTFQMEDGFDSDLAADALPRGPRADESSEMGRTFQLEDGFDEDLPRKGSGSDSAYGTMFESAGDTPVVKAFDSHGPTPLVPPPEDSEDGAVGRFQKQAAPLAQIPDSLMRSEDFSEASIPLYESSDSDRVPDDSRLSEEPPEHSWVPEDYSDDEVLIEKATEALESGVGVIPPTPMERLAGLWKGDLLWILVSVGAAMVGPVLIAVAWEYYSLPKDMRAGHRWVELLDPGGGFGVWFGIAGSILFLLNLTYVLRRRFGVLRKWISVRMWLNVHFVCGLAGGSMILIHSGLNAQNWIVRSSSAAIAVAIASGIFGRYVLGHLPRRAEGEMANRADLAIYLAQLRGDLRRSLSGYPKLRKLALEALSNPAQESRVGKHQRGLSVIPSLILDDLNAMMRTRKLSKELRKLLRKEAGGADLADLIEETLEMVRMHGRLNRRLTQYEAVQDLMDTWRALHMILALIMVVTMFLHVAVVLTYSRIDLEAAFQYLLRYFGG